MLIDALLISAFLDAAIAAFSVLGGIMAAYSGLRAAVFYLPARTVEGLGDEINKGIAIGFVLGTLPALMAAVLPIAS